MPRYSRIIGSLLFAVIATSAGAAERDPGDVDPSTLRQRALADRIDGIAKNLQDSPDIALRALYSVDGFDELPDRTFRLHENIPIAALVELARGSTDPLVLDVLLGRCGSPACDRLDLATRWTQADTQNQVAWLVLASVLSQRGDVAGARATFVRASQASTWHGHYGDAVRRGARALPADLSPSERAGALAWVIAKSGIVTPYQAIRTLGDFCKDPDTPRDACARIVQTMFRDGDDLMTLTVSAPYAARAGIAPSVVVGYRQTSDAVHWALTQIAPLLPLTDTDAQTDIELRESLRRLEARIDVGERRDAERYLLARHVSEAEAAKRYVATLNAFQTKHRAESIEGG